MIDEPFDLKLGALAFGKLASNGFQIAILARLEALAVFTKGVDDTGIETGFAPHDKEAAMAVKLSQIGQIEVTPVGQEQIALKTCRFRKIVVFGIGVRAQGDGSGGILEQVQGAMELDRCGLDCIEAARKDV